MFQKIENVIKALGKEKVSFKIRRPEPLENEKEFMALHEKYGVKHRITQGFSTSFGELDLARFMEFIKEYDKHFDLSTVLIDLESVVINPLFL